MYFLMKFTVPYIQHSLLSTIARILLQVIPPLKIKATVFLQQLLWPYICSPLPLSSNLLLSHLLTMYVPVKLTFSQFLKNTMHVLISRHLPLFLDLECFPPNICMACSLNFLLTALLQQLSNRYTCFCPYSLNSYNQKKILVRTKVVSREKVRRDHILDLAVQLTGFADGQDMKRED